jgi:hypothetical protein
MDLQVRQIGQVRRQPERQQRVVGQKAVLVPLGRAVQELVAGVDSPVGQVVERLGVQGRLAQMDQLALAL